MGIRSVASAASKIYNPSDLAHVAKSIAADFASLKAHFENRIVEGGVAIAPSSASTQATGAGGATVWRINMSHMLAIVNGIQKELAVSANYVIHTGSVYTGLINGKSAITALVMKNVAGTVSLVTVKGTAATTGAQVAPTDAEITAAVGVANSWVKVAECTINRTGDTTVTQTQVNTLRPALGVNVDTGWANY